MQMSQLMDLFLWNRIFYTAMTGLVLLLHGYLRNIIGIMGWAMLELSLQFIILSLDKAILRKQCNMLIRLQRLVPSTCFVFVFALDVPVLYCCTNFNTFWYAFLLILLILNLCSNYKFDKWSACPEMTRPNREIPIPWAFWYLHLKYISANSIWSRYSLEVSVYA